MHELSIEQRRFVEQLLALPKVFGTHIEVASAGGWECGLMRLHISEYDHRGFAFWLTVRELCHGVRDLGVEYEILPFLTGCRAAQVTIAVLTPTPANQPEHEVALLPSTPLATAVEPRQTPTEG